MTLHFSGLLRVYQICLSDPYMGRVKDWAWGKACWNCARHLVALHCIKVCINTNTHRYKNKHTNTNIQVQKCIARLEQEEKGAEMASAIWSHRSALYKKVYALTKSPVDGHQWWWWWKASSGSIKLKKSQKINSWRVSANFDCFRFKDLWSLQFEPPSKTSNV